MTNTTTHTKPLTPKLRFKEFEEEWEQKKLGDLSERIGDGLHGTPEYVDESDIHFVNGNNLISGNIVITDKTKKVDKKTFLKNDKKLTHNTLLISLNGTIGNIARYKNEKVMLGKSVGYFNFNNSSEYYYHVLNSPKIQRFFITELTGSTIKNLSLKTLRETSIPFPNLLEQQKIANFLTAVDTKLQQLTTKKELLAQYKKGVMQQLFSQQLRFKADDGVDFADWEEKRLGEVSNHISYGLTIRPNFFKKGIPLISAREITSGKVDISKAPRISIEDFNNLSDKAKPKKGDIFLTKTGTIGFTARFNGDFPIAITQNIAVIRLNDTKSSSPFYLMQYFKTRGFYRSAIAKVNQSTIMDLQLGDIRKLTIPFPSFKEQQKIANYLSAIDTKIELVNVQITKTQAFKKGLLQQMFV